MEEWRTICKNYLFRLRNTDKEQDYNISPILLNAAALLEKNHHINETQPTIGEDSLFIHRVFHPHGISRSDIRSLYNKILQPHLDFDRIAVAMARPANLRDILQKRR